MKKWLLMLMPVFLLATAQANDLGASFKHTMVAADTVGGAVRRDTVYTNWMPVEDYRRFWFQFTIDGKQAMTLVGCKDSAFAGDSVAVLLQSAMLTDRVDTIGRLPEYNPATLTFQIGQCVVGSADLDTTVTIATSQSVDSTRVWGDFMRIAFVHKDSATATRPLIFGNTYGRAYICKISPKK